MSYQPPYHGNWNLASEPRPTGAAWPGASSSFPEPAQVPREPVEQGRRQMTNGGRYRARNEPEPGALVGIVEESVTGLANAEEPKSLRKRIGESSRDGRVGQHRHWTKWSRCVPDPQIRGVCGLLDTGCDTSVVSRRVICTWPSNQRSLWTTGYRMRHVSRQS